MGDDQPGPHGERAGQAGHLGRADHARHHRRGGVLHDLRDARVADSRRACSGRARTTARCTSRATTARRGRTSRRRTCRRAAACRTSTISPHRRGSAYVAVYRYLLERLAAVHLPHRRLRRDLDAADGREERHPGRLPDARRARGSRPRRAALRRHRVRLVRLVRQRRALAVVPAEPAGDAGDRHPGAPAGPGAVDDGPRRSGSWTTSRRCTRWPTAVARRARRAEPTVEVRASSTCATRGGRATRRGGRPDQPQYPAPGALIDYFLAVRAPPARSRLRSWTRAARSCAAIRARRRRRPAAEGPAAPADEDTPRRGGGTAVRLLKSAGLHRFTWDLRLGTGDAMRAAAAGRWRCPGRYQIRLTAGDLVETKPLELRLDPRVVADGVTQADLEEQFDFLMQCSGGRRRAGDRGAEWRRPSAACRASREATPPPRRFAACRRALVTASGPYPQPMLIDQLSSVSRMAGSADMKIGRSLFVYLAELGRSWRESRGKSRRPRSDRERLRASGFRLQQGRRLRASGVFARGRKPSALPRPEARSRRRSDSRKLLHGPLFCTLPVLSVVSGLDEEDRVSPPRPLGWCSTPRGTMISLPWPQDLFLRLRKLAYVSRSGHHEEQLVFCLVVVPLRTPPRAWPASPATSLTSPTMRGLQRSSNELSFCARLILLP